jgi:hypothetical protein
MKRNGWIERQERPSRQHERLQARARLIQKRREESVTTEHEESIRQQILDGLIEDKGGDQQISTATRILAEVIASDAAWLVVFNSAIDHIIQNNPKARQNPRGAPSSTNSGLSYIAGSRLFTSRSVICVRLALATAGATIIRTVLARRLLAAQKSVWFAQPTRWLNSGFCLSIHSLHSSTPCCSACSLVSNNSPSILRTWMIDPSRLRL